MERLTELFYLDEEQTVNEDAHRLFEEWLPFLGVDLYLQRNARDEEDDTEVRIDIVQQGETLGGFYIYEGDEEIDIAFAFGSAFESILSKQEDDSGATYSAVLPEPEVFEDPTDLSNSAGSLPVFPSSFYTAPELSLRDLDPTDYDFRRP